MDVFEKIEKVKNGLLDSFWLRSQPNNSDFIAHAGAHLVVEWLCYFSKKNRIDSFWEILIKNFHETSGEKMYDCISSRKNFRLLKKSTSQAINWFMCQLTPPVSKLVRFSQCNFWKPWFIFLKSLFILDSWHENCFLVHDNLRIWNTAQEFIDTNHTLESHKS